MKTSELKRILREDYAEVFTESENAIYSVCWTVWKKEQQLVVRRVIPLGVLTVLGKYHNTPISEREDEKKYYIEFGGKLDEKDKKRYLNLNKSTNVSFFHHDWLDLIDLESGCLCYKGKFTQSEIDNFPQEIKGAIECGFLRKVEVE